MSAALARGQAVTVVDAPERIGLYGLVVGRAGRVTRVHDLSAVQVPGGSEALYEVEVPGFVPLIFDRDELRPTADPVPMLPRLVDCDVCDGRGLVVARNALDVDALPRATAVPVLCPRCGGRSGWLEVATSGATS